MYKLMLATRDQEVLTAFEAVTDWDVLGFRAPRILPGADETISSLQRHHVDGIIISLSDEEAGALTAYLNEKDPVLPILYYENGQPLHERLSELSHFLGRLNNDNSDLPVTRADNMRQIRHAYFRKLISGSIKDAEAARRQLGLMRSRMDPTSTCMLVRFSLPDNSSEYLAGRWHYGNERLEVAMRNLFGAELEGMRLLVSVLEDGRIYLLACPMLGTQLPAGRSISEIVTEHADGAIAHVAEYLGINMCIDSVHILNSVTVLADESVRRALDIH